MRLLAPLQPSPGAEAGARALSHLSLVIAEFSRSVI